MRWWVAALAFAAVACGCGEKEERVTGPTRAEVRVLVVEGLRAVGASAASPMRFEADGALLRVRLDASPAGGPLTEALAGARAEVRPFCPKPALLRCRPALVAWTAPSSKRTVRALGRLAERTYAARQLEERRGTVTRIVTANGELLAELRPAHGRLAFSFGGLPAPRRPRAVPDGRLVLEAGAEALAAARPGLSPPARRALAGLRRVVLTAPL